MQRRSYPVSIGLTGNGIRRFNLSCFFGDTVVNATFVSGSLIYCAMPAYIATGGYRLGWQNDRWDQIVVTTTFVVVDLTALLPVHALFYTLPGNLSIAGETFQPNLALLCTLQSNRTGVVIVPGVVENATLIQCELPEWLPRAEYAVGVHSGSLVFETELVFSVYGTVPSLQSARV
jgi:hypothetical protein